MPSFILSRNNTMCVCSTVLYILLHWHYIKNTYILANCAIKLSLIALIARLLAGVFSEVCRHVSWLMDIWPSADYLRGHVTYIALRRCQIWIPAQNHVNFGSNKTSELFTGESRKSFTLSRQPLHIVHAWGQSSSPLVTGPGRHCTNHVYNPPKHLDFIIVFESSPLCRRHSTFLFFLSLWPWR